MQGVAVGWQVYELTENPLYLGYVGLAQFVPALAFALFTGHAADRFDRRRILIASHLALAGCSLLLFLCALDPVRVWPIFAVLFLLGTAQAFSGPAGQALLPHLVPGAHFGNAVAWSSSIWQMATVVGPAVGGALYGLAGPLAVYAACSILSLVAATLSWGIRTRLGRLETASRSWNTLLAGVRYVWRRKVILGAVSLDLFAVLLGGAVALLPVFARDILRVGPGGLGLLRSAPAVGAALMAVVLAYRPLRRRVGTTMFACVLAFGAATIVFGVSRSFPLTLLSLALLGAADMVSVVIRQVLVQIATPAPMRGRVSAVNLTFVNASNELGEFESGLTAAWLGTVPAVVIGGVGTCAVVALWARMFPELRRIDRFEDAEAEVSVDAEVDREGGRQD